MIGERGDDPPALELAVQHAVPLQAPLPTLRLSLRIDAGERALSAIALNVRVQIAAQRRRYSAREAERLWELFGPVEEWGRSLGPIRWASVPLEIGPFRGSTTAQLDLPCAFEPGAAAPKYLAAIEDGMVPLELLFSGTLSWYRSDGRSQTAMVPWDRDASFRMPAVLWRQTEQQA